MKWRWYPKTHIPILFTSGYKEYYEIRPSSFNTKLDAPDGKTIDLSATWAEWILKFEQFADKLRYTGARKKQFLLRCAGHDLQKIYESIDHIQHSEAKTVSF